MQIIGTFTLCCTFILFQISWHQKSSILLIAKINTPFHSLNHEGELNRMREVCKNAFKYDFNIWTFTLNCACDTWKGIYCFLRQLASHALIHILYMHDGVCREKLNNIHTYIDNTFLLSIQQFRSSKQCISH